MVKPTTRTSTCAWFVLVTVAVVAVIVTAPSASTTRTSHRLQEQLQQQRQQQQQHQGHPQQHHEQHRQQQQQQQQQQQAVTIPPPTEYGGYYNTSVMIPMRDGVELFTILGFPSLEQYLTPKTIVINRTPYGTTGMWEGLAFFTPYMDAGYTIATQDFRGRYKSQGTFDMWRDAANDSYDTMQWLANQTFSNGAIFAFGVSADGVAESMQEIAQPPWLKAQYVSVGTAFLHQLVYPNGALLNDTMSMWLDAVNETVPALEDLLTYEADGPWWSNTTELNQYWDRANVTALHSGGWNDVFSLGTFQDFNGYNENGGSGARGKQMLLMEPYGHCNNPSFRYPNSNIDTLEVEVSVIIFNYVNDSLFATDRPLVPSGRDEDGVSGFLDEWVSVTPVRDVRTGDVRFGDVSGRGVSESDVGGGGERRWMTVRDALYQTTGANISYVNFYVQGPDPSEPGAELTNFFTCMPDWPTSKIQNWYLEANGMLNSNISGSGTYDKFLFDPSLPVPTLGGNNLAYPTCGPWDQSLLEARSDVLVYTSPVLSEYLAITGMVNITLSVSSATNDTDFTVKLTDVYPNGTSMLVNDGIIRMRWRDSPYAPTLMVPNQVYNVTFGIAPLCFVWVPGHQIRVDISSSNFPRFSVNPNTGLPLKDTYNVPGATTITTTNVVYHSSSFISLPVVSLAELGETLCEIGTD